MIAACTQAKRAAGLGGRDLGRAEQTVFCSISVHVPWHSFLFTLLGAFRRFCSGWDTMHSSWCAAQPCPCSGTASTRYGWPTACRCTRRWSASCSPPCSPTSTPSNARRALLRQEPTMLPRERGCSQPTVSALAFSFNRRQKAGRGNGFSYCERFQSRVKNSRTKTHSKAGCPAFA